MDRKEQISFGEKIAYSGGDLASNLVLVLTGVFVTYFYTDTLGLNVGIIGMILLVSKVFDGFTDVFMGYLMDKTKSKYGKARPWILWLAIPFGVCTAALMAVPHIGDVGKYIYIFITYNLSSTFLYTAINIPYGALNSLMTRDQEQRASINSIRMVMAEIGAMVINGLTLPFVNAVGGTGSQKAWIIVSCVYGAIASVLFLLCFAKTKERVHVATEEDRSMGLWQTIKILFKNNYWMLLCIIWVVTVLSLAMSGYVGIYFAKYILGNEELYGLLTVVEELVVIVAMMFTMPLIKKFGKRNIALAGAIIEVVSQMIMLLNPTSYQWLLIWGIVRGIGSAPLMATIFAMLADTIEYGQWKTGVRIEGTLYSANTFGAKIGGGVGTAIAAGILSMAGYDGLAATQTQSAINAIYGLYFWVPIVMGIIIIVLYAFYHLDKEYPQIMRELEEREKQRNEIEKK